jgi:hypothetical protein
LGSRQNRYTKARIKNRMQADYKKEPMLNLRSLDIFKYDLRHILKDSSMDEDFTRAFTANLITKASRGSLREAKEYVDELAEKGVFKDQTADKICRLLDRNRKYR